MALNVCAPNVKEALGALEGPGEATPNAIVPGVVDGETLGDTDGRQLPFAAAEGETVGIAVG